MEGRDRHRTATLQPTQSTTRHTDKTKQVNRLLAVSVRPRHLVTQYALLWHGVR